MTFSISARCAETGMFGIAVSSSSLCVAARCAHARAGVGVVASQNITDPRLGSRGLELMAGGLSAPQALARLMAEAPHLQYRQLALLDAAGRPASFSGERTLGTHRVAEAQDVVAAGNLLSAAEVPERMVNAFRAGAGAPLGDRILRAMRAARDAGGEEGPVRSAGMLLVRDVAWPIADLRVDWSEDPIGDLERLWAAWQPEMDAYVSRALDPASAPPYGVPGEP